MRLLFGVLFGVVSLLTIFIVRAIVLNAPLVVIAFLARKRMNRRYIRAVLALGFAVSTAHFLWRMEWFDVWRHGVPSLGYLVSAYVPYTVAVALVGWWLGGVIAPRPRLRS